MSRFQTLHRFFHVAGATDAGSSPAQPGPAASSPGWLAGVLAGVLLATGAGCGRPPDEGAAPGSGGGRLFAVSFQTMNNPFFVDLNEGLRQVIEANGDRLVTLDAQFNSLKQKNDIADVLQQQPAAIFVNPVNWEGIKGSLMEARRRSVPALIVDAPVSDPELVLCQVASDNVEAGRLACEALARVNPGARVVILHLSVNKACIDRVAGFRAEAARHPEMRILDVQEGKGTTEGARPVMRDLLARFPDLNAVFPINDPSALGCLSAIESAGKSGQVTVVTVDGSREGVAAVKAGRLHSTSAQFPREIGRVAAEKAYEHLAGKPVDKDVQIPVRLITRENADAIPGTPPGASNAKQRPEFRMARAPGLAADR
ncbi:MAG: sugar ABC transporter substrate-binding protein [Verrucomicrobiae bacterium]|nr:sugar ABC transporter substrate-binding protein [Verrucomicrobiae bacterium]